MISFRRCRAPASLPPSEDTYGATFLTLHHIMDFVVAGNGLITDTATGGAIQCVLQSPAVQNDQHNSRGFYIHAGAWNAEYLYRTGANAGIGDVKLRRSVDNQTIANWFPDFYASSVLVNQKVGFNFSISDDGLYYLNTIVNSKHSSSSGYIFPYAIIVLRRTGD